MRDNYRESLENVVTELVELTTLVQVAVRDATRALLEADLEIAERVISADAEIDRRHDALEAQCFSLIARQAPVAGELRTVVAAFRMIADLARMGDLAAHVAKIARLRFPEHAVPEPLVGNFTLMARVAEEMVVTAGRSLSERNAHDAGKLADSDEEMDELRRSQFRVILGDSWDHSVEAAVDVALLGRYYERIADHAVIMAARVIYVITGLLPEGENWPTA
ncbi:MAG: phosphate signaling complex protein PhoU [Propionicimonas sp.]|jgi:phosphate transport system protein